MIKPSMKASMIFAAILVACSVNVKAQDVIPSVTISDLIANPVSISNLHLTINSGGAGDNRIDLNEATVEQIDAVPGIGEAKAQAIVDSRDLYKFLSFEEVSKVDGISATLAVRMCDTFKLVPPADEN